MESLSFELTYGSKSETDHSWFLQQLLMSIIYVHFFAQPIHLMAIEGYFGVPVIHFIAPISFKRDVIGQGHVAWQHSDRYIFKNVYNAVGYIIKSVQSGSNQSNIMDRQRD